MANAEATRSLNQLHGAHLPGPARSRSQASGLLRLDIRRPDPHRWIPAPPRKRLVESIASATLLVPLLGCAGEPAPEFFAYQAAFQEGVAASAAMVSIYEPLEIAQHAGTATSRADFDGVYDPDEARWFAPGGRGLVSEQVERGFDAIETYNEVLALYVTGESFSLIQPRLQALAAETAALAAFAGGTGLNPAVGVALISALDAVSEAANRAQFEQAVRVNSDAVIAFLDELRATTPVLWSNAVNAFRQEEVEALREGQGFDGGAARAEFRTALDAWVMSLDAMRDATAALQNAVISDPRTITLDELAMFAVRVRTHSEEARLAARAVAGAF